MWYNIIFIAIVFIIAFVGFTSYSLAKGDTKSNESAFEQLSKIDYANKLEQLPNNPDLYREPEGMCYSSPPPMERVEYICPVCGEKTVYHTSFSYDFDNLQNYRDKVNRITKIDVKLDESQFCRKCTPKQSQREFRLLVKYNNAKKAHKTCGIAIDDINLLYEYSEGIKEHTTWYNKKPLIEYRGRIEELLGAPAKF